MKKGVSTAPTPELNRQPWLLVAGRLECVAEHVAIAVQLALETRDSLRLELNHA